ncbi:L-histidine N(alpha)-methyltransferase [Putridiphycobacter roseus]|uniref:L-histidine N(Alpha)-methyltransferase n=1 Tax=Putridiphycobacter roseus TaxID=2219161 RepID=A0A2W1NPI1_9FLAO|nr:L-histidine N(alpha)-methyltransferase [Putridiphycobacter roseus]PZE16528.1 L-histidine N(alpha)-methyltransferase [Putridiphycobacter roseus]
MNTFKKEVQQGLEANPKTLPSKYFYDKKGDALFVEIMNMAEYYLTRSELDIFKNKTEELIQALDLNKGSYFELIELGAGDGTKTKELLKKLVHENYNFDYFPIDISANALALLEQDLKTEIADLSVKTQQGDYFEVLDTLKANKNPKIILFLGSNIGNLTDELATKFIYKLGTNLNPGDKLLLGVDLIKAKEIVGPAYNDSKGITAAFNINLLERINKQLEANFNLNQFEHQPEYNEDEGIAKSFITSTTKQTVEIKAIGKSFQFKAGEKIHTEISRKYNDKLIQKIIADTDFSLARKIMDSKAYFADYILNRT